MSGYVCRCGALSDTRICGPCAERMPRQRQRGRYDYAWDKLSKRLRRQRPLCEVCKEQGRVTPSSEVHHKVSPEDAPDRMYDVTNLLVICHDCHEEIHGCPLPHHGKHRMRGGVTA
jgi:5-methylcytosine-specific restriction endonuclease McrA